MPKPAFLKVALPPVSSPYYLLASFRLVELFQNTMHHLFSAAQKWKTIQVVGALLPHSHPFLLIKLFLNPIQGLKLVIVILVNRSSVKDVLYSFSFHTCHPVLFNA